MFRLFIPFYSHIGEKHVMNQMPKQILTFLKEHLAKAIRSTNLIRKTAPGLRIEPGSEILISVRFSHGIILRCCWIHADTLRHLLQGSP
jgi:hypothetical protein